MLTVFHNADSASSPVWATNADSDAKRDIHRSAMTDGYDTPIVTSYPQFTATDANGVITGADGNSVEQDDNGLAEKTGFIVTANSSTWAGNTPYTFTMEGVNYDVAYQVSKREHVNTGLFKVPTSQITGIVWDDTETDDNTAPDASAPTTSRASSARRCSPPSGTTCRAVPLPSTRFRPAMTRASWNGWPTTAPSPARIPPSDGCGRLGAEHGLRLRLGCPPRPSSSRIRPT